MNNLIASRGPELSKERAEVVKNALRYNFELFSGEDEIWPDQCDYALSRLGSVKAFLQDCCRLLDSDSCFSVFETTKQPDNEFIVILYYAREQLGELQEFVTAFQPICRSSSKRAWKKRAEILSKLEIFMYQSDDIVHSMTVLQEEPLQKRSAHHSAETKARVSLVQPKENEDRRCQQQREESRCDRLPGGKPRPSYLTLV